MGRRQWNGRCRWKTRRNRSVPLRILPLRVGAIALADTLGRICAGFRTSFRVMGGVENRASMSPQFRRPRFRNDAGSAVRQSQRLQSEVWLRTGPSSFHNPTKSRCLTSEPVASSGRQGSLEDFQRCNPSILGRKWWVHLRVLSHILNTMSPKCARHCCYYFQNARLRVLEVRAPSSSRPPFPSRVPPLSEAVPPYPSQPTRTFCKSLQALA